MLAAGHGSRIILLYPLGEGWREAGGARLLQGRGSGAGRSGSQSNERGDRVGSWQLPQAAEGHSAAGLGAAAANLGSGACWAWLLFGGFICCWCSCSRQ